ncbi:MAG TPA: hypothetical protein ENJ42_06550 [Hellea balneolensis]|uniref:LPS-assembly lipoprotein n=1 Tax=Hellea balneolensis TaxID=287478 RepID=A0A7C5LT26_9PROT|nr:hypothetical protein [Hellea balneolensis]
MKQIIKLIALAGVFTLGACGFKPMHAPTALQGAEGVAFSDISVSTSENLKKDFLIKQALRNRIGNNTETKYRLDIESTVGRKILGVGADDVASRYDLVMRTKFSLIDRKTGKAVFNGRTQAVSTYGAPRDPYGTITAGENATEQVAGETADRIINRLAGYFQKRARRQNAK